MNEREKPSYLGLPAIFSPSSLFLPLVGDFRDTPPHPFSGVIFWSALSLHSDILNREELRCCRTRDCTVEELTCLAGVKAAPMGNKATAHLELPNGEASTRMSGDEEGCTAALPTSAAATAVAAAAAAADASDEERVYASPGLEGEGAAPVMEERAEDAINFTRNNSQSSMGNRLPLAAATGVEVAAAEAPISTHHHVDGSTVQDEVATAAANDESVLPPPPLAPTSASPPRALGVGGNDLQLPPLNDPHPLPGSEEAARAARGSPNSSSSVDGRDQKGAQ